MDRIVRPFFGSFVTCLFEPRQVIGYAETMYRLVTFLVALVLSVPVAAQIYKRVLPDGTVQFSDRPQPDSEEIKLEGVQTYDATAATPRSPPQDSVGSSDFEGYTEFKVASPAQDAALRDNGGTVSVRLSLEPSLQPGHTVDFLMDGQVLGSGKSLSLTLNNVDRGTHTVAAVVKDESGREVARTPTSTFHLKRYFKRPLKVK